MGALVSYLSKRGLTDGVLRGRRMWTVIGAAMWIGRLLVKVASRRPEIVAREVLAPGQSITVTSLERDSQ